MTPASEVALSVLGTGFVVSSDDVRIVDLVRALWGPFVVEDPGLDPRELHIRRDEDRWTVAQPPHPPISAVDPWIVVSAVRNSVSGIAIANAGPMVPVHGAAVERDGVFLVLSGPVRAGKTTLLLELLDRGWLLVTDDLVALDPETLTARPFQKPLSVRDPETWRRFSRGWDVPAWLPDPTVVGLIPATAMPHSAAAEYRPSLLVFPRFVAAGDPFLEVLTPAQVVAWCGDNLHSRGPGEPGLLPAVARLSISTPGYTVRYGSTGVALELLEKCLAGG